MRSRRGRPLDHVGVSVRVPHFGSTKSVDVVSNTKYFQPFTQYFVEHGYVRGESIRAAPYDFRLGAGT